ncbi:MAG: hypothetical protein IID32_12015, partial [Planctomycetes bacterium]|nr:hypothetical protein [Planctomycetota bacterium]
RISFLSDDGRWDEEKDSVFGLPKVGHRKATVGKKVKKKTADDEDVEKTPEAGATEGSGGS